MYKYMHKFGVYYTKKYISNMSTLILVDVCIFISQLVEYLWYSSPEVIESSFITLFFTSVQVDF